MSSLPKQIRPFTTMMLEKKFKREALPSTESLIEYAECNGTLTLKIVVSSGPNSFRSQLFIAE
ncbi:MAG: hypothetical protein ACFCU1_00200 [Sumerlaeia bacterium]